MYLSKRRCISFSKTLAHPRLYLHLSERTIQLQVLQWKGMCTLPCSRALYIVRMAQAKLQCFRVSSIHLLAVHSSVSTWQTLSLTSSSLLSNKKEELHLVGQSEISFL